MPVTPKQNTDGIAKDRIGSNLSCSRFKEARMKLRIVLDKYLHADR